MVSPMMTATGSAGSGRDKVWPSRDGAGLRGRPPAEEHATDDLVAGEEAVAAGVGRRVAIVSEQEEAVSRHPERLRCRQAQVVARCIAAEVLPVPGAADVGLVEALPGAAGRLDQHDGLHPTAVYLDRVARHG